MHKKAEFSLCWDLTPLRVEPSEAGGCELFLLWGLSISRVSGLTLRGQDLGQRGTDKEDANSGVTMATATVSRPPEDAGRVGFLSFTFSFFPQKENSSALYFTTTIAWTSAFKCFKKQPKKLLSKPLSAPACRCIVPAQ